MYKMTGDTPAILNCGFVALFGSSYRRSVFLASWSICMLITAPKAGYPIILLTRHKLGYTQGKVRFTQVNSGKCTLRYNTMYVTGTHSSKTKYLSKLSGIFQEKTFHGNESWIHEIRMRCTNSLQVRLKIDPSYWNLMQTFTFGKCSRRGQGGFFLPIAQ